MLKKLNDFYNLIYEKFQFIKKILNFILYN